MSFERALWTYPCQMMPALENYIHHAPQSPRSMHTHLLVNYSQHKINYRLRFVCKLHALHYYFLHNRNRGKVHFFPHEINQGGAFWLHAHRKSAVDFIVWYAFIQSSLHFRVSVKKHLFHWIGALDTRKLNNVVHHTSTYTLYQLAKSTAIKSLQKKLINY